MTLQSSHAGAPPFNWIIVIAAADDNPQPSWVFQVPRPQFCSYRAVTAELRTWHLSRKRRRWATG